MGGSQINIFGSFEFFGAIFAFFGGGDAFVRQVGVRLKTAWQALQTLQVFGSYVEQAAPLDKRFAICAVLPHRRIVASLWKLQLVDDGKALNLGSQKLSSHIGNVRLLLLPEGLVYIDFVLRVADLQ